MTSWKSSAKGLKETRINGQLHVKAIKHSGFFFINLCIFPELHVGFLVKESAVNQPPKRDNEKNRQAVGFLRNKLADSLFCSRE